jgi:hypothetical protein
MIFIIKKNKMDKNNIRRQLVEKFVNEATPGIAVTKAVLTKSKEFNDDAIKDSAKRLKDIDGAQKKSASSTKDVPQNKFNYNSSSEEEYHQQMEIMNGQEMIEYDREPDEKFKDRATKAIEGHPSMGNSPDYANVVPEQMGFTGPTFGKKLVKSIKASTKKRQDALKGVISFGDDIETVSKNYAPMTKFSALSESKVITENLNEKVIEQINNSILKMGHRKTAKRLINIFIGKATGMSMDDFSDTTTVANGMDTIEELLKNNDYKLAIENAKEVAIEILEDEGFPMGDLYENIHNTITMGGITNSKGTAGYINNTSKQDKEYSDSVRKQKPTDKSEDKSDEKIDEDTQSQIAMKAFDKKNKKYTKELPADISGDDLEKTDREMKYKQIKETNNKKQTNEGMKRLKFKQEFKGVGNALKLIPESYKVDNKVFEMTDGTESYRMRWEGTLTEGKAVVLMASDKTMVNEDIQKMKHLMGYKSQDTLGLVKGKARIDENTIFSDIWKKSVVLVEGENIEGQTAPEKKPDEKITQAGEAKKHVKGTSTTDKGTQAPKAKTGSEDTLEKVKSHAPEAKKHVHVGTAGDAKIGMGLGEQAQGEEEWDQIDVPQAAAHTNPSKTTYAPKPVTGEWDKANVPHAHDAKKHVHMNEGIQLGENFFAPMSEELYMETLEEETLEEETLEEEGDC